MLSAGAGRHWDIGSTRVTLAAPVESVDLRFEDRRDGAIVVRSVAAPETPRVLMPGTNGFVRTALRSMAQERLAKGAGADVPFRLARQPGGGLWIEDLATGRRIGLDAFGAGNAKAFEQLLASERVLK
jgi:putative photosynthetic complex assembly protein